VISGHFTMVTINEALEAGASDYLHKPLVARLLTMRLGILLKLRNIEQQYSQITTDSFLLASGGQ